MKFLTTMFFAITIISAVCAINGIKQNEKRTAPKFDKQDVTMLRLQIMQANAEAIKEATK